MSKTTQPRDDGSMIVHLSGRKTMRLVRLRRRPIGRLLATLLMLQAGHAAALPTGAQPVAGSVTVTRPNASTMNVQQATDKAIVNWTSFGVGRGEVVNFAQPGASSVILNRVVGGDYSQILGQINANGHVFLVNPIGIQLGTGAMVDAAGFVASTLSISNADFLAGRYVFSNPGGAGAVINQGVVNTTSLAALLAPQVRNEGTISARLGTVGLAAGDRVTLDFRGDGLVRLSVDEAALRASVSNSGAIVAEGGNVLMTARAANAMVDTVLNMEGVARATSLAERNGTIVLDGGPSGVVNVSGTLDASGRGAGETGGTVKVLGNQVGLFGSARIDASGSNGGGTVLVGGNFQGKGPEANAAATYVGQGATINADALTAGNGGQVIVWADGRTQFYGNISARGAGAGGNGGFAEVSGKETLDYRGFTDLRAPFGAKGTLLLDPADLTVISGAGDPIPSGFADPANGTNVDVQASVLVTALDGGNVTLFANRDVSFNTDVDASGNAAAGNLTVRAGRSIVLGNNVDLILQGSLTATFNDSGATTANRTAGAAVFSMGTGATITAPGGVTITGGTLAADSTGATSIGANTGDVTLRAITTTSGTAGTNGGIISVTNNAAAGKNITANSTLDSRGAAGGPGGTGGNITLNASGTLAVAALNSSGGAGAAGNDNGGNAGAISLTGNTAVTLNGNVSAIGGAPAGAGTQGNGAGVTFASPVTLGGNVTVNASGTTGGNIGFNNTVNGANDLVVTTTGTATFAGAVGTTTALSSFTSNGTGGTTAINTTEFRTDGNQTHNHAVTIGATTLLTSQTAGVTMNGTLAGAANDIVIAANTIVLGGGDNTVSGTGNLTLRPRADGNDLGVGSGAAGNLQLSDNTLKALADGFATITLGRTSGTGGTTVVDITDGAFTFKDPVTIRNGATGTVTVTSALGASGNATITLDAGAAGTVNLNNDLTTANQAVTVTGAAVLGGAGARTISAGSGAVTFNQTLNGGRDLTVNSTGTTTFTGIVGGGTRLTSLTTDAGGTTAINTTGISTTGAQTYNDAVTLGAGATLDSNGSGNITLAGTVNGGQTLAVNTAGTTTFGGVVGGSTRLIFL